MDVIHSHCAGLDVHKKTVQVCIRCFNEQGQVSQEFREFGTMTGELQALSEWLAQHKVSHVAMESTGVFWKPVFNILEAHFEVLLCNARHVKNVPGRKTDMKDSAWLAQLLQCGLLRGSFIPFRPQRELRDLTRARACLQDDKSRVANRIHKVLEDANIKLGSVATDILGVTGRAILEKLIAGETDPKQLAEEARRRLKAKKAQLETALQGNVNEHHRFMLRMLWDQLHDLEVLIDRLDGQIVAQMGSVELSPPVTTPEPNNATQEELSPPASTPEPNNATQEELSPSASTPEPNNATPKEAISLPALSFDTAAKNLDEVWGINQRSAENILAEIGTDMSRFPSAAHLASWAGLCPGNNESAGKKMSGKTRKGNHWLRRALTQAAWAATHAKKSYFGALYRRLVRRRGKQRALVAVAHSMLKTIYHMLQRHSAYSDLGVTHFDSLKNKEHNVRNLLKRLENLGYTATLTPKALAS